MPTTTGTKRKSTGKTAGRKKTATRKRALFSEAKALKAAQECDGSKILTAQKLGCCRTTLDKYIQRYPALQDFFESKRLEHLDDAEDTLYKAAKKGNLSAAMFILKTQGRDRGWVEARPLEARREASEEARAILADLREFRCTAAEAAIRFDQASMPIPDSVRLLLAKETLEAPDPTEGKYAVISPEEMASRREQRLAEIGQQQEEFLPQRRQEVAELKKENADSFSPLPQ